MMGLQIQSDRNAMFARFASACGFEPKPGRLQYLPDAQGGLAGVLFGLAPSGARGRDPLAPGKLATALPAGIYRFANAPHEPELAALAFLLALYRFDRYHADASPRRSRSGAISSTRRPTILARARWRSRRSVWLKHAARVSRRRAATRCSN